MSTRDGWSGYAAATLGAYARREADETADEKLRDATIENGEPAADERDDVDPTCDHCGQPVAPDEDHVIHLDHFHPDCYVDHYGACRDCQERF